MIRAWIAHKSLSNNAGKYLTSVKLQKREKVRETSGKLNGFGKICKGNRESVLCLSQLPHRVIYNASLRLP